MDGTRFDHLTQRFVERTNSRRGLLRFGVGSGFAAVTFGTVAEEALACRRTGKPCAKRQRNGNCCSGTCRRGKCRPTKWAAGCTVTHGDHCKNQETRCPNNPEGICLLLDSGKPFCIETGDCHGCTSNADCIALPNGKCVTTCPACGAPSNNQGCFYPQRP